MSLESFRTVWKVSGQSGKFPGSLESFRTVWKVSGLSGKFLDSLESFWTVWKVSGQSGKFPGSLESFWIWEKFPKNTPFFNSHHIRARTKTWGKPLKKPLMSMVNQ
jgi:hypothetical protein